MKKVIAVLMALALVLTMASCGVSKKDQQALSGKIDALSQQVDAMLEAVQTGSLNNGGESGNGGSENGGSENGGEGDVVIPEDPTEEPEVVTDPQGEVVTDSSGEAKTVAPKSTTKKPATTTSNDPSNWTTQQIVDYYKKAAAATTGKSMQKMSIQEIPGVLNIIKGPINSALEKRSGSFNGITGGYKNLKASDLTSASAKQSGNYIIINMTPKEQIDGAYGKAEEGTTGHLVSVLNGVATALADLGVKGEYPDGSVKLDYKNGYAKNIKINAKTGKIESGTWGYDLYVNINGAKLAGITLKNVNALILYRVSFPA